MKGQSHVKAGGLTKNHSQTVVRRTRLVTLSLALATLATLSHAAEGGDWIPDDRPSAPPLLVTWDRPIEDVTHPRGLTVQVANPRAGTFQFDLNIVAFGLDFRTVRRRLGTFQLGDFGRMTHTISVRDLPIQSVSHSSELAVEAVIPHWGEKSALSLPTPPAYYHFSADYSTVSVYGFDTMMDRVSGGQHTKDPFNLQGRVREGETFVEINALRQREAKEAGVSVVPTLGPNWNAPYIGGYDDNPPPSVGFPVCIDWKTKFVDAGAGDYANSSGEQFVDAAYAKAEIRKVVLDPCPIIIQDQCTQPIWAGYLDSQGCVRFEATANQKYIAKVSSELKKGNITSKIEYFNSNKENKGVTRFAMSFVPPPQGSPLPYRADLTTPFHATTNVAATMSRLLSTPESGMMDGAYDVHANIGCNDGNPGNPGIPPTDSCAGALHTFIGPLTVPGSPIPGDIAWKFVIGHEFGHQVQRKAIGIPGGSYEFNGQPDPPAAPPSCRCDHVVSANQLHCLQSQERWGAAEREGFAHFIAAKIWNKQNESDCSFNYYKEFRLANGTVTPPPHLVSCRSATQWRDNHCFEASFATELDWMQFLWNVDTVGPDKVSSADLRGIYKEACGGSCSGVAVTWPMMDAGALKHFGSDSNHPKYKYFKGCGDTFSVDLDQF